MAISLVDSFLFNDMFGSEEMRKIFDDINWVQKWLDVEVALAEAEADRGVIPREAAHEIAKRAKIEHLEHQKIREKFDQLGHPLMALIKVLQQECKGGAGEFIHWGATTQDIMDTALILQIKEALIIIRNDLNEILRILIAMAKAHRDTVMIGRTHGQHALPTTFGFKVAIWCKEITRHMERLDECKKRVLTGQLGGAVGTMASFGEEGLEIQRIMMEKLGLDIPDIAWHAARDRIAELINVLNMISSTLGKIAEEIFLLQKNEINELEEAFVADKISSSTMPHKKNPATCEAIVGLSRVIQTLAYLSGEIMRAEHERDMILLKCEWLFVPQYFVMFGAILKHSRKLLQGLRINKSQMKKNLEVTDGLILSEQIMLHLAQKLGRQKSHEIIKKLTNKVTMEHASFEEVLLSDPEISKYFARDEIKKLLNPIFYTGLSALFVDKIVAELNA